jgi:hypothetical protein
MKFVINILNTSRHKKNIQAIGPDITCCMGLRPRKLRAMGQQYYPYPTLKVDWIEGDL